MTARALVLATVLPLSALAQMNLVQFNGTTEIPVGTTLNVGSAAPGDTVETRFRVVNAGTGPATLQTLGLSGQGFTLTDLPQLPYIIAPGFEVEFRVDFTPATTGSYSAFLQVTGNPNTITVALTGTAVAGASLMLAGSKTPLAANAVINFGSVTRGSTQSQGFMLFNAGTANITVNTLGVTGAAFSGPIGLTAPIQLGPGQTANFQVMFAPQSGQAAQGTLVVDSRTFNLTGQGLDPPLPAASIVFASSLGASAQQNSVSIALASASQVPGSGTLTMQFQPSIAGVIDDPSVGFLSGNARVANFTIAPGNTQAQFNGQPNIAFQMGTTAGTIVFTLQIQNQPSQQASLNMAPLPVQFDLETAVRNFGVVGVSLAGFDNTYSASQMVFTFHLTNGQSSGPINVDATSYFQNYFASTPAGGMFDMLLNFPVTGDTSQIVSVDIQIVNSVGVTTVQQIPVTY